MNTLKEITIHTDGACIGNPGPGGYGVVLQFNNFRKEISGGFRLTTNNRMELKAVIEGLKALKYPCKVTIFSDSKYIVDAINKGWLENWILKNWYKNKKKAIKNIDLWTELRALCKNHQISFQWVKGHAGNIENERCDTLAMEAAQEKDLLVDVNFETKDQDQMDFFDLD